MESLPKILIIMPAYNEEEVINYPLSKLFSIKKDLEKKMHVHLDICIVNDGSSDQTAQIASCYEIILLNLKAHSGVKEALKRGYQYAYENNYDIAVQFDADGQHNEQDLNALIMPVLNNEIDMMIGSRFLQKTAYKGSFARRIGIFYFYKLLYLLTGKKFTDPTSGFRAKNRKVIEFFAQEFPAEYLETAGVIYLSKKNIRIKEIATNMRARQGGISSIPPSKYLFFLLNITYLSIKAKFIEFNTDLKSSKM